MSCEYIYKSNIYTESEIKDLILEQEVLKNNPIVTFTKKIFKTLPYQYKEDLLNEGSKKYGIARGKSTATIKYSQADQNKVDFGLKAVEILQSDKAKQVFDKGRKNLWSLDKILTELGIPKEQKELIKQIEQDFVQKQFAIYNEPVQYALELASNYSYTIEISTAKEPSTDNNIDYERDGAFDEDGNFVSENTNFSINGFTYEKDKSKHIPFGYGKAKNEQNAKWESISEREYNEALNNFTKKEGNQRPTQHYSNLTVPGGTNYTENEIATPAITPSIKGHAQFATDNGIGWFRSDDRQINLGGAELSEEYKPDVEQLSNGKWEVSYLPITGGRKLEFFKTEEEAKDFVKNITKTSDEKTRRILEVQSDLFQKGRGLDDLVTKQSKNSLDNFSTLMSNLNRKLDKGEISLENYRKERQILENNQKLGEKFRNLPDNQFLQLLNKDSNWVTFFIKSIIQDSAKKGYEKVLFPSGNTASKIEGHATLEEFKKQKEDRIKELETKIQNLKNSKQFQKLTAEEKAKTIEQVTKEHRSIAALKDLSAKLAHRIGGKVEFENKTDVDWKGYNQGMTSVLNEAYMTPDTPFHEILAHPIIRAIKNKQLVTKRQQWNFNKPFFNDQTTKNNTGKTITHEGHIYEVYELKKFSNTTYKAINFKRNEEIELSEKEFNDIVNQSQLYQNLLKELETGRGKEVLDGIKRDYKYKEFNKEEVNKLKLEINDFENDLEIFKDNSTYLQRTKEKIRENQERIKYLQKNNSNYTLEEQQEEAIVELLGLMTAEKLDSVKDGKLISLLKRLLKEIKTFVKSLLNQKEVEVDKLPDNMTLGDLSDLLAYSNSKLILPGYEVEYTTPDNEKFKTYQEASNHISQLSKSVEDVDLDKINLKSIDAPIYITDITQIPLNITTFSEHLMGGFPETFYKENNKWMVKSLEYGKEEIYEPRPESVIASFNRQKISKPSLKLFIEKNKEYEQSKEIIEEWKKVNNIQYNPEEIYSRGQGFYSSIGAYSNLELDLLLKNLIQHIEDNKKAGGEFTISAFTKPIDKRLKHIEGTGDRVRFVIYPKSEHIKWAAPTDVYSGSVWDAHEKVSKDKKSELLGVSFTKAPALRNINEVSPNLADIIDNLSHAHNELGIELTTDNFRIEYDDNIPYSTKKIVDGINSILDQKYGKLIKPNISNPKLSKKFEVVNDWDINDDGSSKTIKRFNTKEEADEYIKNIQEFHEAAGYKYGVTETPFATNGIEPKITNKTLKESIDSVKNNQLQRKTAYSVKEGNILRSEGWKSVGFNHELEEEYFEKPSTKEYTSQALINTKIAALKEVARKYPRSLITSKVVPINPNMVDNSEIQYSKVENIQDLQNEIKQLKQELERVETEGFGALKPIYNFYENDVTNILNKTYGKENVKVITDEYGNTWNEIIITPKMAETIRLNTPNGKIEYTGDLAIEEKMAEEAFNSKDEKVPTTLIGKFIQFLKNLLRNLFKERDNISRLIRNLNQGRFNLNPSQGQGIRYSTNQLIKPGVEELFDSNFLIFAESKTSDEVISKLLSNKIIDKKCN